MTDAPDERLLEAIVIILMTSLTAIVLVAVAYRKMGASLSWYDEIASILLAWLTYYGAALAAIHREHIGFAGLIKAMKPAVRIPFIIISEICILGFFALLAFVWLIGSLIYEGVKVSRTRYPPFHLLGLATVVALITFLVAGLFSMSIIGTRPLWFFGGVILSLQRLSMTYTDKTNIAY